ncbi:Alkaline phosphatase synthesis sensor protein PhoR [Clostridium ljungdahlii DSM 13528]|uniref:histidine kinase n=1 Tax=Clostridium ljungdahlii (strain ATCC 55383 / DSM 13528 / PETC) TaxID=748727 RepID=D8GSM5_CLOLD|nr:HAMP domain-containing sensor histidine kinase [Clostridium ljungdahlii]ADK14445.1 predicted sensory transduction histidine kinase [Clostridium ljungdahlii DSM 13528]OAA88134.1 Alkaline phosphatase synthesis sensor protein PhoR [Clostridium ljungdahlii DSM 13528]
MKFISKIKTNWTLTTKFLVTLIFIVIIELFINLIVWNEVIVYTHENLTSLSPERITLNFSEYIDFKNGVPFVKEDGKNKILKNNAWIQIIDENFKEVYSFNKPKSVPTKYTPIEYTHIYKYDIANSSVFVSEKKYNNKSFAYIVGFPLNRVAKHTLTFNPSALKSFFWNGVILLLCINILAAIIIAYFLFGKRMAKPLQNIISGINNLAKGNYEINYPEKGVYKSVFSNLNNLSKTLKENKTKRDELEKMRNTWISSISHDVKTPLSSIKGYAEIMKDPDYTFSENEIHEYSEIIYNKSSYIQSLVEDLNLTYKLKNKAVPLKKEEVNITSLLQNIIVGILNHPMYSNRNVKFYPENEKIKALIDKKFFKRALSNLIFNAITHNNEDVQVDISIYEKDKIYIIINDNGKGIPKKDLNYIFERYYRGTNTSVSTEGSGLGMAISKQIIDAHGGSIHIESTLGEGTIITIIF